jgi:ferredoxin
VSTKLGVNPIACSGHGMCAELLPELISADEWGYPVISDQPVPAHLARQAKRAVTDCPALALRLTPVPKRAAERGRPGRERRVQSSQKELRGGAY